MLTEKYKVEYIIIVQKCKIEYITIWTYFPNLSLGFKASRFFFIVLYFWESFVEFLIFFSTKLKDEKNI